MFKLPSTLPRQTLLMAIGAFCLPIKLSLAYAAFIPLIAWRIIEYLRRKGSLLGDSAYISAPLLIYFFAVGISSFFGLNPAKSIPNVAAAAFMALLVPVYASINVERQSIIILVSLIAGQTIAGIDSIFAHLNVDLTQKIFVGEVTESGQLALVLPALFGLLRFLNEKTAATRNTTLFSSEHVQELISAATLILLLLACSASTLNLSSAAFAVLAVVLSCTFAGALLFLYSQRRDGADFTHFVFSSVLLIALPLTLATIIENLKRGPWAGVLVGLSVYFLSYRPRAIIPVLAIAVFSFATITPVRERILSAREHFFISGGRSEIWDIGAELITTYPTGIGFRNSAVLGKFSKDIPDNLRHFHSNPINIAVESGALGFVLFYWWIARCLACAFRVRGEKQPHHALALGIGCALISWQTAGLVEFNAGDSEVLLMAYVLTGALGSIVRAEVTTATDERHADHFVSRAANSL